MTSTPSEPGARALVGRSALITGGGSGIGLATARALVRDGASVTIAGRSEERLRSAVADLETLAVGDARVAYAVCDVADEDQVRRAVEVAEQTGGGLHIAVASAGNGAVAPIVQQSLAEFRQVVDTNLVGAFLTIKHAGRSMVRGGGGSIVAVSSLAARTVHAWMSAYGASKAGIDLLVRNAADELGASGVRVNSVQPSLVDTELVAIPMGDEALLRSYLANMPVSHVGQPEEVADVIRFLAGPESRWVTGNCLPVDGGHHLRRGPDYGGISRFLYGDESTEPGYTGTD